eukprot:762509-Hanusia_phi.AAC.2
MRNSSISISFFVYPAASLFENQCNLTGGTPANVGYSRHGVGGVTKLACMPHVREKNVSCWCGGQGRSNRSSGGHDSHPDEQEDDYDDQRGGW